MTLPQSLFTMTWKHYDSLSWVGLDWVKLTRREHRLFRRPKSTIVHVPMYSFGEPEGMVVQLWSSYGRVASQLAASPWAPHHMVEQFAGLVHAMDTLLATYEIDCAGPAEQAMLRDRVKYEAINVKDSFDELERQLTYTSSRRTEEDSYAHGLRMVEMARRAREDSTQRFDVLNSTYADTLRALESATE